MLCIDARMLYASGIGTFLKNLIPFFDKKKTILLIRNQDLQLAPRGYPIILCTSSIYSVKEQIELPFKIPTCDLFWSPHYNIPILPVAAKHRVVTIHDVAHLAFKNSQTCLQNRYARFMLKQAVKKSDFITTDSLFSQKEIARYLSVNPQQIQVIAAGIDCKRFKATSQTLKTFTDKYKLPEEFLLFVGNLKPHKNLKLLVECYRENTSLPPLVVVGKREGLLTIDPVLKQVTAEKIRFVGQVEDNEIPLFYQTASLFVFPSCYEGFGLPPLEAMASGCPVIASCSASIPEVCGDAAVLLPPSTPHLWVQKIMEVMKDRTLREELIAKGFKQVEKYRWEQTAATYQELFLRLS
ncbi:MAG: hypothetical protein RLZZ453_474 [Chlamydiota bacterium]|jgi:glycosyltransferase involved in cell wall biosynthesis